jgi:hypothetical protein
MIRAVLSVARVHDDAFDAFSCSDRRSHEPRGVKVRRRAAEGPIATTLEADSNFIRVSPQAERMAASSTIGLRKSGATIIGFISPPNFITKGLSDAFGEGSAALRLPHESNFLV